MPKFKSSDIGIEEMEIFDKTKAFEVYKSKNLLTNKKFDYIKYIIF